ncbi:MAG: GGDEF domain-containing protein [Treponema sp.]|nr:GGDEF domain-containing protein [Treponema sp.]
MVPRIKDFFGFSRHRSDIIFIIDTSNIRTARIGMVVIMLLELGSFITSFFFQVFPDQKVLVLQHRIAYIILFVSALQLFLYCILHKTKENGFSHVILNISLAILLITVSIFGIFISAYDCINGEDFYVFITFEIFITCLFIIRPFISIILISSSFISLYLIIEKSIGASHAIRITFPVICICFIMASIVQYHRYLRIARYTVQNHAMAEQMKEMSLHDPLTGLKNRLALREDFIRDMEKPLILLISDIDDFKVHNDTRGHEHGDTLLEKYARQLETTFGAENCYRYGGDEFLVVVKDYSLSLFLSNMELCKNALSEFFQFSGGYTAGVAHSPEDLRTLINQADENLYKAKRNGKNQIVG